MMEKGNLIVNSGGYRVLNSYMVLGVTIKREISCAQLTKHEKQLTPPVDPESAQADKLRHLLNVVSGRAPDTQGRTSEPLVKEELAIVEFLTAKTNAPAAAASGAAAGSSSGSGKVRPSGQKGGKEETPVDLLLGLAKTRSGKRAAEEEQRQLRLQTFREQEEQRNAATRGGSTGALSRQQQQQSQSPWGYQPPSMPGLDVQQPFGSDGSRRQPRPLQPPPSRRPNSSQQGPSLSSSNSFNQGTSHSQPQTLAQAAAAMESESMPMSLSGSLGGHGRQLSFGSMGPAQFMSQSQNQQNQFSRARTTSTGAVNNGTGGTGTNGGGIAWPESFDVNDLNIRPASAHSTHHSHNPQPLSSGTDGMSNTGYGSMQPPHSAFSAGSGNGNVASPNTVNQYPSPMGSGSVNGSTSGQLSQGQGSGANETLYMAPNPHGHGSHGGHGHHPFQLSPFNSMSALPSAGGQGGGHTPTGAGGQGQGQGQEYGLEQFIQSMQAGGMGGDGASQGQGQFGSGLQGIDGYGFGDLDLGLGDGGAMGGFNPFALQQTEEG